MNNINLRNVLIETLERTERGVESVVIQYSDGTYESAPRSAFAEYTRDDPDAKIVFMVDSLNNFGEEATADDIPDIVERYILPYWDEIVKENTKQDTSVYVLNWYGKKIDFEAAIELMDNDLRELVHNKYAPCNPQLFFDAYAKLHELVFGEEWELDTPNPVW